MNKIPVRIEYVILVTLLCLALLPFVYRDIWGEQETHISLLFINIAGFVLAMKFAKIGKRRIARWYQKEQLSET